MTDFEEQGKRLTELIDALKISQTALAERLGVTRGYISVLVNGGKPISQSVMNAIARTLPKVNIHWLITGEGDMLLEKKSGPEQGVLNGVMEPEGEYGGSGVGRGEGRLEWQERKIQELLAEIERLRERLGDVEREQLEMNRRLAKLEGRGE